MTVKIVCAVIVIHLKIMLKKQVKMNREPVPIDDVSPVMTENEGEVILEEMSKKDEDQVQSLPTTQKNQFPNTQLVEIAVTKEEKRKRNMNMNGSLLSVLLVISEQRIFAGYNYDIGDFDLTLLEGEAIRGEEVPSYPNGVISICAENIVSPEERIRKVFNEEFGKHPTKQRVVHDIYGTNDEHGNIKLDNEQLCRKFSGAVIIIAHHGNHIHIVNDCSYSNNSCRCSFTNQLRKQINRRYARRVVPSWQFSLQHWVNLSIYLQKDSREYLYYNIAGRTWLPSGEARCLRFFEDLKKAEDGMVEGSQLSFDIFNKFSTGSEPPIDHEVIAICDQSDQSNSVNKKRGKGDKVSILQLQYIIF
ncbi:uncharacterized protein [Eurosta solidaginis]